MASLEKPDSISNTQYLERVISTEMELGTKELDDLDIAERTKVDKFIWLVCFSASLGGFLFGYDTGVISSVLICLSADLGHKLSNGEKELVTSITSGGALVGTIVAGLMADRYGRKGVIYVGCVLFVLGAILQATAPGVIQMTSGRLVVGFGIGSVAMVVPLYIAETSPARYRGKLIGINTLSITFGQLVSYGTGALFGSVSHGWRWMVGLAAAPAILLACLLPFLPESPRQLLLHQKTEEASKVLQQIFPNATPEQIQHKIHYTSAHIKLANELQNGKSKWWSFKQLFVVPANLRATAAACGVMALSQFTGFNNLMYYSATLFSVIGFKNPVGVGSIVAAVNCVFAILYINVVDRFGRRRVLLCTVLGVSFFLALVAVSFHYTAINNDMSIPPDVKVGWSAYLVLVSMMGLVVFYASGIGPLSWVSAEFFPMEVRSLGTMVMTISNWAPNILISSTFLTQMEKTTPTVTFASYSAICCVGWIAIYFCYPEVQGLTLEGIKDIFEDGFGIQKARNIQKEIKKKALIRKQ